MARKLTFLLADRTAWKLAVRTALSIAAFLLVREFDFSAGAIVFSLAVIFAVYFSETPERRTLRLSYFSLMFFGLAASEIFAASPPLFWGFFILCVLGIFAVLGLIDFIFPNRELIYGVLNTLIVFLSGAVFFYLNGRGYSLVLGLLYLFVLIALFIEAFGFFGISAPRRIVVYSVAVGLVLLELAWILGFLPLGYLNAALFLTLISLIIRDAVISHFRGKLDLPLILRELVIFYVLGLIIFAASNWSV